MNRLFRSTGPMNHLRLILRNLQGRPARNLLTALGIAIAVAAFVALVSLADSFTATMTALFRSRGTHISVVRANSPDVLASSIPEGLDTALTRVEGVLAVAPVLAELLWAEGQPASMILGLQPGTYLMEHFQILEGRDLQASDQDVVLLGQSLARRLGKRIGEPFEIESYDFQVVGIYDAGNTLENSGAVLLLHRLQWLLNREGEVTAFNLRVDESAVPVQVAERIDGRFRNLAPVVVTRVAESNSALRLAGTMARGTSLIALCIGLIGTFNSLLMSVLERTREIGLLRALGWSRRRVCLVLLGESLVLSLLGGLAGLGLGAAALETLLRHPRIEGVLTAGLGTGLAAEALALALGLGFLGGLLPALRGSGLSPQEALRQE